MRLAKRRDDSVLPLGRKDSLEAVLAPRLADGGRRTLAAEERSRALRVPRAPLVVPGPPRAGGKQRLAQRVERLTRHEDDELAGHDASASLIACSVASSSSTPDAAALSRNCSGFEAPMIAAATFCSPR